MAGKVAPDYSLQKVIDTWPFCYIMTSAAGHRIFERRIDFSNRRSEAYSVSEKRLNKVLKLHILKPADGMTWPELGELLKNARYRVFRLANLAVSEEYLRFHLRRKGAGDDVPRRQMGVLNKELREMLEKEGKSAIKSDRFSKTGALPDTVVGALSQYKLRGLTTNSKWSEVTRGRSSLPTFRLDMAIPIRCDKAGQRRLERTADGEVALDLMVCIKPYPRVIIATKGESLGDGQRAILDRLLNNEGGYRQRCLEVKQEKTTGKWHLFVTYDFPTPTPPKLSDERIIGADLGFSCPIYAATSTGHARLGWRHFASLAAAVRSLQSQTIRRRRAIQQGGKMILSGESARSGHGRNRKLQAIEKLQGRIDHAYQTLNHRLSATVIKFALDNGAGVIQIEDLEGLKDELTGTFLGERWRYAELQRFLEYKAKETGIKIRKVDPRYTSRRCSECGYINMEFTREYRDANRRPGRSLKFTCPQCKYEADADYNAARNLATDGIAEKIARQAEVQAIKPTDL